MAPLRHWLRVPLLVPALLCAGVEFAHAAWVENGIPIAPGLPGGQHIPNICPDGAHGAYIAWQQYTTTEDDAYIQHVTAGGEIAPGWPTGGVLLGPPTGDQFATHLAPDGVGGVYVTWFSYEGSFLPVHRLVRLQADGSVAPGWPATGVMTPMSAPDRSPDALTPDGQGGVYLIWTSLDYQWMALHYSHDGQVATGWNPLGQPVIDEPTQRGFARVIPDASGGFLATYFDARGRSEIGGTLYALKVLPDGEAAAGWPVEGVRVNSIPSVAEHVDIVSDGSGGAYIGWNDNRYGTSAGNPLDYEIYGQHVLADGTLDIRWPADGLPIVEAPSAQYFFELAEDGSGGLVAVWDDYRAGAQIYAVRLHSDGAVAAGWVPNGAPVAPQPVGQTIPTAVGDGAGGVYAFWAQNNIATADEVLGQHLGPGGQPAPGWPSTGRYIARDPEATFTWPFATGDGAGGAIVAYERGTVTSQSIYAQRVLADGPVPARIAFLDAEVEPGLARLRWSASDAGAVHATVQRRSDGEPWSDRGAAVPLGASLLAFEDREIPPGRYAYRLAVSGEGGPEWTAEEWIEIPAAHALALAGFVPNPASGPLVLGFSLPAPGPASVTVHDVRGRAVFARDVSALGPGTHHVDLGRGARLAAGVYWIRLTFGDRVLRTRGVVLR